MTENGKKVIDAARKDSKVMKILEGCKTREEAIKVLNDNGYDCELEDFKGPVATNAKVSVDEAKAVAGGTSCGCVLGGGGTQECNCVCFGNGGPSNKGDDTTCFCPIVGGGYW